MQTGRHTAEQIVAKLRQAEVELAKGRTIPQVSKLLGITDQTYYRWRNRIRRTSGAGARFRTRVISVM